MNSQRCSIGSVATSNVGGTPAASGMSNGCRNRRAALAEAFLGRAPDITIVETGIRIFPKLGRPLTLIYHPNDEVNQVLVRWSRIALTNSDLSLLHREEPRTDGIIADSLTSDEKKALEALKMSYLALSGELCLFLDNRFIKYAPSRPMQAKKSKARVLLNLVQEDSPRENAITGLPSFTLFVSPHALDVLDVVFRVDDGLLRSPVYAFAKHFSLVQPRVARMMKETGSNGSRDYEGYPGLLHGGIQASILDELMANAVVADCGYVGITLKAAFNWHRPIRINQPIFGEAKVLKRHKRYLTVWASIHLDNGKLATSGKGIFYLPSLDLFKKIVGGIAIPPESEPLFLGKIRK